MLLKIDEITTMYKEAEALERTDPVAAHMKFTKALFKETRNFKNNMLIEQTAVKDAVNAINDRLNALEASVTQFNANADKKFEQIEAAINKLESAKMIALDQVAERETYSRSWSFRIAPPNGSTETAAEDCAKIVSDMLKPHLPNLGDFSIVHRVGRFVTGKQRMILAQMVKKSDCRAVLKERHALWNKGIRVYEDLSPLDVAKKKLISHIMKDKYDRKEYPSFRRGKLYVKGEVYPFDYSEAYKEVFPTCF